MAQNRDTRLLQFTETGEPNSKGQMVRLLKDGNRKSPQQKGVDKEQKKVCV
jgi:hypothetical protein